MSSQKDFTQLVQQHQGIIYKVSAVYAKDREDQKDLFQEIVYQLYKSLHSFKGKSKVSTWIYRVALNTSIAHLNNEKKRIDRSPLNFEIKTPYDSYDSIHEERLHMLYEQIKLLSMIEKGVILLYLEGKTYQEIAQITGFTASNVGTRLSRIKEKLKKQLKNR